MQRNNKNYSVISSVILLVLLLSQTVTVLSEEDRVLVGSKEILIFGSTTTTSSEHYGTYSLLKVTIYRSSSGGKVFISSIPIPDKSFYASAFIAAHMAASMAGYDFNSLEFYYEIAPSTIAINGPSAGAALAIVTLAALLDVNISREYGITGMILPGGIIGPVGSLKEKIDAAHSVGVKTFLLPYGQSEGLIRVNDKYITVKSYAEKLGIRVVDVLTIQEGFEIMTGKSVDRLSVTNKTDYLMYDLQAYLIKSTYESMNNTNEILEIAKSYLNNSKIPLNVKNILNTYILNSTEIFNDAKRYLERNEYYVAISRFFQSRIYSRTAIYLGKYFTYSDKERALEEIYQEVLNLINNLSKDILVVKDIVPISELLNLGAAQYRLLEAEYYLEKYNQTVLDDENIEYGIYALAYAYERALTAGWWMKIPERTEKKVNCFYLVRDSMAYAQSLLDLVESLGLHISNGFGLKETEWIALKALESQYYPGAFYASSMLISKIASALYLEYLPAELFSIVIDKLNGKIEEEIPIMESWINTSAFLVRSKLEFSKYLISMNMLEDAVENSLEGIVLLSFLNQKVYIPVNIKEIPKESNSVSLNINSGIRAEIFLVVGIVAGIVIGISLFNRGK